MQNILENKVQLSAEVRIDCESNGEKYYYRVRDEFNGSDLTWVFLDGDAYLT